MRATSTTVVTPTARTRLVQLRPYAIIVVLIAIAAVIIAVLQEREMDSQRLSALNPQPDGARALVEVLHDQGVSVTQPDTAAEAIARAQAGETLVVINPGRMNAEISDAVSQLDSVVYVGLSSVWDTLESGMTVDISAAETPNTPLKASCDASIGQRAPEISPTSEAVQVAFPDWVTCFPLDEVGFAYASGTTPDGRERTIISNADLLRNDTILEYSNAALALNALGQYESLVWYIPAYNDRLFELENIMPTFMIPALIVLLGAGLYAGLARGRRLGRLVPEDIPSAVPAAETVVGRGRLMRSSRATAHAGALLRSRSAERLARRVGISISSDRSALHNALVAQGVSAQQLNTVLWGPAPRNDAELIALVRNLEQLEESISHD